MNLFGSQKFTQVIDLIEENVRKVAKEVLESGKSLVNLGKPNLQE